MVSAVAAEAAKPNAERKQGVLRGLLQSIGTIASITVSLSGAWEKVHPILTALLSHV